MFHIKTYNNIATEGLELLEKENYMIDESDNPHGIILRSQKLHDMEFNENLLAIARAGAGTNNVPVKRCAENGIVVFNTPGANANAVKELVLIGLLIASRPVVQAMEWVQTLEGPDVEKQVEAGKKQFVGTEIMGKTLGVIGLGAIGSSVANTAYDLGMEVIGFDPFVSVETAWNMSSRVKRANSQSEVLNQADFVSIHVPANEETTGMVNTEFLATMKDGAVLLDFSRGELIDNPSLLAALESGKISRYVTDFANADLLGNEKIYAIPHMGASTEEAETNCAMMAASTLKYFLETGNIRNSVNFPTVDIPLMSDLRIAVINENVANMIGQMSAVLAKEHININNIINRGKDEFAYTLIDIDMISEDQLKRVKDAMQGIDGVLNLRVIVNQ